MGRTMGSRPLLRVHYRKLVDDYGMDGLTFDPPLPDYLQYCCRQCGHRQNVKVCIRYSGRRKCVRSLLKQGDESGSGFFGKYVV